MPNSGIVDYRSHIGKHSNQINDEPASANQALQAKRLRARLSRGSPAAKKVRKNETARHSALRKKGLGAQSGTRVAAAARRETREVAQAKAKTKASSSLLPILAGALIALPIAGAAPVFGKPKNNREIFDASLEQMNSYPSMGGSFRRVQEGTALSVCGCQHAGQVPRSQAIAGLVTAGYQIASRQSLTEPLKITSLGSGTLGQEFLSLKRLLRTVKSIRMTLVDSCYETVQGHFSVGAGEAAPPEMSCTEPTFNSHNALCCTAVHDFLVAVHKLATSLRAQVSVSTFANAEYVELLNESTDLLMVIDPYDAETGRQISPGLAQAAAAIAEQSRYVQRVQAGRFEETEIDAPARFTGEL